ncbi:MAG: type II toxin-antitoxin system RelE/ParE family toxin [Gammaproteobacteria bacterium]|nr:type II toxin-antitoxin system RelE/ParE family toxin [Gammaproteobacteria bacterium]
MICRFDDSASEEFLRVVRYYAREDRRLSARLIEELHRTASLLVDNPKLGRRVSDDFRQIPLRRFPYFVIYRIQERNQMIRLVAFVDQRQQPGAWRLRVEEPAPAYVAIRRAA